MFRQLLFLILLLFVVGCTVAPDSTMPVDSLQSVEQLATTLPTLTPTRPKLIEFYANWCPVCKEMHPTVQNVRAYYGDKLNFTPYDIDDPSNEPLRKKYGYRVQPYFVLLDSNDNVVKTWQGTVQEAEFKLAIDALLTQ